jgi:acyl-coenzyme A synthetase/AMP-(fatty) acid ligase
VLPELPRNAMGKVQKNLLREMVKNNRGQIPIN